MKEVKGVGGVGGGERGGEEWEGGISSKHTEERRN